MYKAEVDLIHLLSIFTSFSFSFTYLLPLYSVCLDFACGLNYFSPQTLSFLCIFLEQAILIINLSLDKKITLYLTTANVFYSVCVCDVNIKQLLLTVESFCDNMIIFVFV